MRLMAGASIIIHFEGKTVFITSGCSGIGRPISKRFADERAEVFTAQRGEDERFGNISAVLAYPCAPQELMNRVMGQAGRPFLLD